MILRQPRLLAVAVAAGLSVVAIGVTIVERVQTEQQFQSQTHANCEAIETLKAAITDVFNDGRQRVIARRTELDPAAYRESIAYYDRQLARFQPKEC